MANEDRIDPGFVLLKIQDMKQELTIKVKDKGDLRNYQQTMVKDQDSKDNFIPELLVIDICFPNAGIVGLELWVPFTPAVMEKAGVDSPEALKLAWWDQDVEKWMPFDDLRFVHLNKDSMTGYGVVQIPDNPKWTKDPGVAWGR